MLEIISNLIGLFLLMGVGFVAVRLKVVPQESSAALSALLLKITLPATLFSSLLRPFQREFLVDSAVIAVAGLGVFGCAIAVGAILAKCAQVPEGSRGIWAFGTAFCNNGFMGYPIILAILGEEGLALAVILGIPFNLLVYSLGVKLICMDCPAGSGAKMGWRGIVFSNINIAVMAGLVFYLCQIPLPEVLATPIGYLSDVTTPLSMFVTGMSLAAGRGRELFQDRDAFTAAIVRLLVMPILTFAVLRMLPFSNSLIPDMILITMAMPAASVTTILAENYGGNTRLAAKIVFLSSLLCIITIPAMLMLL